MPKKTSHSDNAALELARFADVLANSEEYIDAETDAFGQLVETYISQGRDDILQNALSQITSDDGFEWLLDDIITYSENKIVTTKELDILDSDDSYDASLFLIPIIMTLKPNSQHAMVIKDADIICKSFRQNHLTHDTPIIAMHPELLSLEDVDVPPSKRREMLDYLVGVHNSDKVKSFRKTSENIITRQDTHHVTLRYVLVNTISDMLSDNPFHPLSESDDDIEAYEQSLNAWRAQFAEFLEQQIDAHEIIVGEPESFNDGLMEGVFVYHQCMLIKKAQRAVYDCAKLHSICKAIVSTHVNSDETETEILVGFYDDHHAMVQNMVIPVPPLANKYDIEDYLEMATETLDDAKVDHVTHVSELMPLSRCSCCNEPEFPATQYPAKRLKSGVLH